ncbi:MAG: DegV family protein [Oscillospiraceae bacterium]|jgi:DegV family protein with EDD domain|nr:DegV family protein [Oscillospiraceae bacterium]
MNYTFMTDSNSDLPYTLQDEHNIPIVYMPYTLDGVEYFADLGRGGESKAFFDTMRAGATPVTSLLPTTDYLNYFEPILKEQDLLFIAFSSQLSATIQNIYAAREQLLQKYPDRKFIIADTMSISGPQINLILGAHALYRAGEPIEAVAQWVEDNKMRSQAWFTVDDLKYLKRGGRISGAAAFFGTMLSLKPILVMGKGGKISPAEKVQGRQKALHVLAERTAQNIENPESQTLIVMHADAIDDAQRLADLIRQRVPTLRDIMFVFVGPVIGTHCGPGTVASCFMGKERSI